MSLSAYIENDNILTIAGLMDNFGNYQTGATVTYTIKDENGAVVSGAEDIACSYISDAPQKAYLLNLYEHSDGYYQGLIADTLPVSAGNYSVVVNIVSGGITAKIETDLTYIVRS